MSVLHGWLVRNTAKFPNPQRVLELVEAGLVQFPSLQVTLVPDGTSDSAMCINGTLPVVFHGNTFNIPVEFSLPPMFPEHSPMAYVRPTAAMMIRGGKHVDGSGRVFHPYLASWSWGSTLGELFECLIAAFSLEPP
ncbi:suppressor protein stp22 of temperature-sensitive alpha-factor receptor and arginine permease, partial [Coemansia nantahalensis]